jgi:hypothetical protein
MLVDRFPPSEDLWRGRCRSGCFPREKDGARGMSRSEVYNRYWTTVMAAVVDTLNVLGSGATMTRKGL